MSLKISNNYSPNFSIPKRKNKMIKFIVIHYTGMKSESVQHHPFALALATHSAIMRAESSCCPQHENTQS